MKKTTDYVIYRKGSNAANQPLEFGWVPVKIVAATSRDVALQTADVQCYHNQVLRAVPESRVSTRDWNAAVTSGE